jgi:thiol-disulfide isomerase/thioredoxin
MKKIFLFVLFATAGVFAQDKVKFAAQIQNRNSDSLTILSETFQKVMVSDKKGNFKDAFDVEPGFYQIYDGSEVATIYLKEGFDLKMTLDAKKFDETISFKGKGEKENNFIAKKFMAVEKLEEMFLTTTDSVAVAKAIDETMAKFHGLIADKEITEEFRTHMTKQIEKQTKFLHQSSGQIMQIGAMRGKPSPAFTYENHKGGTTSLADLKGKYVYIDVWATWCAPCREEIPYLQQVEHDYKGKKIEFVSISIDTKRDYEKWKKMVAEKSLGGIQLVADKDWKSDFVRAYHIDGIPRFILVDPQGNVVNADAPRPSDEELRKQLDKLLK